MLKAENLSKSYNGHLALKDLNLSVSEGEIYCLLGANGAGKSTTINLFLNFISPTSGEATINKLSVTSHPLETKKYLTYIPENLALYPNLTGIENLAYFTGLSGFHFDHKKLETFLIEAGLQKEAIGKRVVGYSKGMRQKVGIAIAIARESKVLLLDEPTSGLDPVASNDFAQLLTKMRDNGASILMATHDLFRAKETGTRIGMMNNGVLVDEMESSKVSHSDLESLYIKHMKG
jgi:ABC-2 type transport system ATP-binding protein